MRIKHLLVVALLLLCATVSYGQSTTQKSGQPHLSPLAFEAAKKVLTALRQAIAEQKKSTPTRKKEADSPKDCIDLDVAFDEAEAYLPFGPLEREIRQARKDYQLAERTNEMMQRLAGRSDDPEIARAVQSYLRLALTSNPDLKDKIKDSDDPMSQLEALRIALLDSAKEHVNRASTLLLEQQ